MFFVVPSTHQTIFVVCLYVVTFTVQGSLTKMGTGGRRSATLLVGTDEKIHATIGIMILLVLDRAL